jgi:serine/threonine protein kinase
MGEDSPLLTPDAPGDRGVQRGGRKVVEEDPLFTPEDERGNKLGKRKHSEPEGPLQRSETSQSGWPPFVGRTVSASPAGSPSAERYKKIKKVGVGAYGSVYMAQNVETEEIVAVKQTSRKEDPVWQGFPLSLLREIAILRSCKHPSIVQLHELWHPPSGDPLMVMEYCQSSLLELLNSRSHDHNLSFSEVKYIIRQVLDATRHMHEKGILHRDLATKNVLFNLSGEIKVCDFGISRFAFGEDEEFGFVSARKMEPPNMIVSLPYRAVELLLGQEDYGPALDIWSAGCILGEILLCQGGVRRTFFGGNPERPNKTDTAIVEEIFLICGRPTEQTWPRFTRLPWLSRHIKDSQRQLDRLPAHTGDGTCEERLFLRKFFVSGSGKGAHTKYHLSEACLELLGGLLTLCPAKRFTAEDALKHSFFSEKPTPEWHAWHWALAKDEIARGDDMKRQEKDELDTKASLLRRLSTEDGGGVEVDGEKVKSVKERAKEALERRASEKKLQEERRLAAAAAQQQQQRGGAGDERMPHGWTKHWSSSKQCYYYHDASTGKNQWHAPNVHRR